jgi:phosphoadenosine phosphosulfate reductase
VSVDLISRVIYDDLEIGEIANDLDDQEPEDVIEWALNTFDERLAIVTALQIDGMVLLDMAYAMRPDIRVVTVDTGRLPPETLQFLDTVRARYPLAQVDVLTPDPAELDAMVNRHGTELFKTSVPLRLVCCQIRKVRPMLRALEGLDAWFTGLRRDQWASRAAIRKVELDHDHDGIVKVNPLADWAAEDVSEYLEERGVPPLLVTRPMKGAHFGVLRAITCFDRGEPEEIEKVRALNLELLHRGLELGFVPYKAPDWAVRELAARADPGYRELFERLRSALDPSRIMNPARLPFGSPGEGT